METKRIIEEILESLQKERNRIDDKIKSELYSINECRDEAFEVEKCIEIVLNVAKNNFSKDDMKKIIKEYLKIRHNKIVNE